jgi:hypothetical protein
VCDSNRRAVRSLAKDDPTAISAVVARAVLCAGGATTVRRSDRLCLFALLLLARPAAGHHGIGTDLARLNLCLYGDCEARGTYAADPFGVYNPANMTYAMRDHLDRGVVGSGSYYHLDVGGLDGDVGAGVVTLTSGPVAFQVATVYAEARGGVDELPGTTMHFRTRAVRLATGVDLDRLLGVSGLSFGLAGVVPGTTSDLRLLYRGRTIVSSTEQRDLEMVPGVAWRAGERDWFAVGAFLDATRNDLSERGLDPVTHVPLRRTGTSNSYFARVGVSVLPFVPLVADGDAPGRHWLRATRLGIDVEHRSITIPDERSHSDDLAYFGADAPLVPDALNPLGHWLRPSIIGGVDTMGGWGVGLGLYGSGPLRFLGCNVAFSSRPNAEFIGTRVDALAATCSAGVPL